jgi:hypothetical protein
VLTGALTAPRYDSVPGGYDSDTDCGSDFDSHADVDYAYGLGEFGYVDAIGEMGWYLTDS